MDLEYMIRERADGWLIRIYYDVGVPGKQSHTRNHVAKLFFSPVTNEAMFEWTKSHMSLEDTAVMVMRAAEAQKLIKNGLKENTENVFGKILDNG